MRIPGVAYDDGCILADVGTGVQCGGHFVFTAGYRHYRTAKRAVLFLQRCPAGLGQESQSIGGFGATCGNEHVLDALLSEGFDALCDVIDIACYTNRRGGFDGEVGQFVGGHIALVVEQGPLRS